MLTIRNLLLILLVQGLMFSGTAFAGQQDVQDNLPTEVKQYLTQHFATAEVTSVSETDGGLTVELDGVTELRFDDNYEVYSIRSSEELPSSVVPSSLSDYVSEQYPDSHITGWSKSADGQKVTLNDGTELQFDADGNFSG